MERVVERHVPEVADVVIVALTLLHFTTHPLSHHCAPLVAVAAAASSLLCSRLAVGKLCVCVVSFSVFKRFRTFFLPCSLGRWEVATTSRCLISALSIRSDFVLFFNCSGLYSFVYIIVGFFCRCVCDPSGFVHVARVFRIVLLYWVDGVCPHTIYFVPSEVCKTTCDN